MQGYVKWFNGQRGYGFVNGQDGSDYFIHQTNINMEGFRTLEEGQEVTFDLERTEGKKEQAVNLEIIAGGAEQ